VKVARLVAIALGSALFVASAGAYAQSDEDPEALVRRGIDLARRGDQQGAYDALRSAVAAQRTGRGLAELGYVEQSLGHALDAETHLTEAMTFREERWVRHHRDDIEAALALARSSIGSVAVRVNIDGAEVRVNRVSVGRTPLAEPVRVVTGRNVIEVTAEGYVNATSTVTVVAGEAASASLTLERVPPPAPEAPPPPRCAPTFTFRDGLCYAPEPPEGTVHPYRWLTYGTAAASVISASVALGLWVGGNGDESAYLARCGGRNVPAACDADRTSTQESLSSRAAVVNTLWVLSGITAATALLAVGLEVRASRRRPTITRVALSVAPMGVRLTW
jgi:PEGA domain